MLAALSGVPALPGQVLAQAPLQRSAGGGVLTRSFQVIDGLEQCLERALAQNDAAALRPLLSPVFVLQQPGRDLVTAAGLGATHALGGARLLHVHETGNTLVAVLAPNAHPNQLVTDVWQQAGDGWVLRVRVLPGAS